MATTKKTETKPATAKENAAKVEANATNEGGKTLEDDGVYEPSDTSKVEHNPYDTKAGGKPAAMLADGTRPGEVTKSKVKTAE